MAPHTGMAQEFGEFSTVFGIEPERVGHAAHELADHGGRLHRACISLERNGPPPSPALPGGVAATAVAAAVVRISGAATAESAAAEASAAQLHNFVAAVGIAETRAAESFTGDHGGGHYDGLSRGRSDGLNESCGESPTGNPGEENPAGTP